jgi:hypothetical protein
MWRYVSRLLQVRQFAFDQYAASGLTMHAGYSPVEVKRQENGLLTCVVADKEGNTLEIADNDHVSAVKVQQLKTCCRVAAFQALE